MQDPRLRLRNELGERRGRWPEVIGLISHGLVDCGGWAPDSSWRISVELLRA